MFKRIPGNSHYEISLNGEIRSIDGSECTPPIKNGFVKINIYGIEKEYALEWLSLVAYFEIYLPFGFQRRLFDVTFSDLSPKIKVKVPKIVVFDKPILVDRLYRIIPGYTRYAISKNGILLDLETGILREPSKRKTYYPWHNLYCPRAQRNKSVPVHRLLAFAWIHNFDFVENCVINHLDGNKTNYNLKNLEWTSFTKNSLHAVVSGLRTDNVPCMLRDFFTKEIIKFPSMTETAKFLGLSSDRGQGLMFRSMKAKLLNDRYEIKRQDDNSPWFYEDSKLVPSSRYIIDVVMPDGDKRKYFGVREMLKDLKLWNIPSQGIWCVLENAKLRYPGLTAEYQENFTIKPVEAMDIETKKVYKAETLRGLSTIVNTSRGNLMRALKNKKIHRGLIVRYQTDESWNISEYRPANDPKCISAFSPTKNQTLEFESLRDASKYFNVDRETIKWRLDTSTDLKGWILKNKNSLS